MTRGWSRPASMRSTFGSFKSNVGIGMRFHTPISTPLRIEVAKGSEGMQLIFAASAAF